MKKNLFRRILILTLVVSMLLGNITPVFAIGIQTAKAEMVELPINPAYEYYLENPQEFVYGYRPPRIQYPVVEKSQASLRSQVSLPEDYDARDYGLISPVKDQNPTGTCWVFAALAVVETAFKKKDLPDMGYYNFSEGHVALNANKSTNLATGGNAAMAMTYFSRLDGPVFEEDYPSIENSVSSDYEYNFFGAYKFINRPLYERLEKRDAKIHVGDMVIISKDEIKDYVLSHGAVDAGYCHKSTYYINGNLYHHIASKQFTNHDITIVGWDDTVEIPVGEDIVTGAYLVKNSWGEDSGEGGYYWISYDTFPDDDAYHVFTDVREDVPTNIYQYDPFGSWGGTGYVQNTITYANVYTRNTDKPETITDIAFDNICEGPVNYKIYISQQNIDANWNDESGPSEELPGDLVASGRLDKTGYYTVDLNNNENYKLTDNKFAVICKFDVEGSDKKAYVSYAQDEKGNGTRALLNSGAHSYFWNVNNFVRAKQDGTDNTIALSLSVLTKSAELDVDSITVGGKTAGVDSDDSLKYIAKIGKDEGVDLRTKYNANSIVTTATEGEDEIVVKLIDSNATITDKSYIAADANNATATFTVTAEDGVTQVTYTLELKIPALENIFLTEPTKKEYSLGEIFDTSGLKVMASYNDPEVPDEDVTDKIELKIGDTPIDNETVLSEAGEKTVRVIYTEGEVTKEAEFGISVNQEEYTITYDANGGRGTMASQTAFQGEAFTLPENEFQAPRRKQFDTWEIVSADGSRDYVEAGETHIFTANSRVYAVWIDIPVTGLTLKKDSTTLTVGRTETLVATVTPSDAVNKKVTWTSDDENVATVDSRGRVKAVSEGTAIITVTTEDGNYQASCTVTVIVPVRRVTLNKRSTTLIEGQEETLTATVLPENATNKDVTWRSSLESVATVDENGKVTAHAPGRATITVTTVDGGRRATCRVTVKAAPIPVDYVELNKYNITLGKGLTETLVATVYPNNATNKRVTWGTNDSTVATVDSRGRVRAVSEGIATITAIADDGLKTATCTVEVTPAPIPVRSVTLNKRSTTLIEGQEETLTATILPENATNKDLTWRSGRESVATVDENGKVTAHAPGRATITVTTVDGGRRATCTINVTRSELPLK